MNNRQQNLLYLNLATLLGAGPTLFAKLIELPALSIVFGRALFGFLGILLVVLWQKQVIRPKNGRDLAILLGMGVSMAIHWVALFYAVQISTVAVGIISVNTGLIMTILLEPLFFGERFSLLDLILGLVMFAGLLVLVPEFELSNDTTRGVMFGVISAFFFVVRTLLSRRYVQRYPSIVVMGFQLFGVAAVLALPAIFLNQPDPSQFFSWRMILLGLVFTALLHTLYVQSLSGLKAKTTGLIGVLQVPYSILAAMIFLAEYPPLRTWLGGVIVVVVVVIETLRTKD